MFQLFYFILFRKIKKIKISALIELDLCNLVHLHLAITSLLFIMNILLKKEKYRVPFLMFRECAGQSREIGWEERFKHL